MDPLQFCYWLQGFAELNSGSPPNDMQWKAIRDHLALVFNKVTPTYPIPRDIGTPPYDPNFNNFPPVWSNPNTNPLTGPYTVTCSSADTVSNNQTMAIC